MVLMLSLQSFSVPPFFSSICPLSSLTLFFSLFSLDRVSLHNQSWSETQDVTQTGLSSQTRSLSLRSAETRACRHAWYMESLSSQQQSFFSSGLTFPDHFKYCNSGNNIWESSVNAQFQLLLNPVT